jgi:hypothetical protein
LGVLVKQRPTQTYPNSYASQCATSSDSRGEKPRRVLTGDRSNIGGDDPDFVGRDDDASPPRSRTSISATGSFRSHRWLRSIQTLLRPSSLVRRGETISRSRALLLERCLVRRLRRGPGWAPRDFGRRPWRGRARHRRRSGPSRDRRSFLPWRLPGSA